MYRVLTPEEVYAYERERREEEERRRFDTGVIGQGVRDGVKLNVIGPRTRKDQNGAGTGVKRPKQMCEQRHPRHVQHLLRWFPMTSFEIRLEDIGALVRQWEEEKPCNYCEATGKITKENPNHFHYWARRMGDKCSRCAGRGRVLHAYEERIQLPQCFIRSAALLFIDAEDTVHAMTKKGRLRSTRCRVYTEISKTFLTGYGHVTCMMCLAWMP